MTVVMSYAADRTEEAQQAAPTESAPLTADAPESAAEVTVTSSTELPATPDADSGSAPAVPDGAAPDDPVSDGPVYDGHPATAADQASVEGDEPGAAAPPVVEPWPVQLPGDVVDLARAAAAAEAGTADRIGEHVDSIAEDQVARTIRFAALDAGYRGWQWSVTLALLPEEAPTVSEVVLLPGPDALVAPAWLPWDQRLRPGDLGPTDLLPAAADDPRLVPGYVESDDPAIEALATEVGLGRERVLSREGRDDAAERWHDGPFGPASPTAKAAPGLCGTCGFFAPLAGSLGGAFGVCANEFSPADARVVDVAFGCGAHSEVPAPPPSAPMGLTVLDEVSLEVHRRPQHGSPDSAAAPADGGSADHAHLADAPDDDGGTTALTDAAETAPTLDVVIDTADLDTDAPAATDAGADTAAPAAGHGTTEPGAEAEPGVAVEPETVTAAGAVSGSEAEIVVTETDVTDQDGSFGEIAPADPTEDPAAGTADVDASVSVDPTDGEPSTG